MTDQVPPTDEVETVDASSDPGAAAKIPATDPSLLISRPVGRRLRKGAVAATVGGIVAFAAILVFLATSVRGSTEPRPFAERDDEFAKPVIPETVRNAEVRIKPDPPPPPPLPPAPPPAAQPSVPTVADKPKTAEVPSGPYSAAALRQKRIADFWKARAAGILVQSGAEPTLPSDLELGPQGVGSRAGDDPSAEAPRRPGLGGAAVSAGFGPGDDQNLQGRKNEFVAGADPSGSNYLHASVRHPRSPFELKPGTIIPAVLMTAINSDLPGPVIARVTQNICDSVRGEWRVVSQGDTLVADYDSMVAWGQERVLLCWKQLELANGDSLDFGCMPAADATGQAGLNDEVDEHWWRIVKGAGVASLLSAATTAAAGNTAGYNPTIPQLWAHGAASEIGTVGQQVTRRNIMVQPTLTIRQGMPVNVILTKTIDFRPDGPGTPCRPEGL